MIFSLYFIGAYSTNQFPSLKFPKGGIFQWFDALSIWKKPFNNKSFLGFKVNSTSPDLSMIVDDILDYLNIKDMNISQKIYSAINDPKKLRRSSMFSTHDFEDDNHGNIDLSISNVNATLKKKINFFIGQNKTAAKSKLLTNKCDGKTGNMQVLCEKLGLAFNSESIGIPEEHMNAIIGNIIGFFPTTVFLMFLVVSAFIYYVVQIILSFKFFRPQETKKPAIWQMVLFYSGDFLVFLGAVFYLAAFTGINDFISTLGSLDTIFPRVTYSLCSSLLNLVDESIPNSLGPIIQIIIDICDSTSGYLISLTNSLITPTKIVNEKLTSANSYDYGVFGSFIYQIQPTAQELYRILARYSETQNIPNYFNDFDFSSYVSTINSFLTAQTKFADGVMEIDAILEYFKAIISPYRDLVINLRDQNFAGDSKTLGEALSEVKASSLNDYNSLVNVYKLAQKQSGLWRGICAIYFIIGILLLFAPIAYGILYMMNNKFSRCVANTAAIFPMFATIVIFALSLVFTGIGYAEVDLSDKLEKSLDYFIDKALSKAIPTREILFPPITINSHSLGFFDGVIDLSDIVFERALDIITHFVNSDETTGVAKALQLEDLIPLGKYGEELGKVITSLGLNFTLGEEVNTALKLVQDIFGLVKNFPKNIDGFFNWGIPITIITSSLRNQIYNLSPQAYSECNSYLYQIDGYVNHMNRQYRIALNEISVGIPNALSNIDSKLSNYISGVMRNLGNSLEHTLKHVYPLINSINIAPIIGPYAVIRNCVFYDLAYTSAYFSLAGHLMIIGYVVVVTMMWIRRKGMMSPMIELSVSDDEDGKFTDESESGNKKGKKGPHQIYPMAIAEEEEEDANSEEEDDDFIQYVGNKEERKSTGKRKKEIKSEKDEEKKKGDNGIELSMWVKDVPKIKGKEESSASVDKFMINNSETETDFSSP